MTTGTMIGSIVRSEAGRDAGRLYVVIGMTDDAQLLLSDGRRRRISRPKKKKHMHAAFLNCADGASVRTALENGSCTDRMLRAALAEYRKNAGTEDGRSDMPIQERRDFSAEG